jgi:3-isopropylmalate/(R)-2-methylmalate dehydratase small subunit
MAGWRVHTGQAVALARANVDTDQLIPARFMSVPRVQGYGDYLLHDVRRTEAGDVRNDFSLNNAPNASVLIAGPNFGSGSSREAAVYALVDAGVRAVFAPSFGDIFASNAINNGLLPARIDLAIYETLVSQLAEGTCEAKVDLENKTATIGRETFAFALDETWRTKLMNGWDDIDLTQQHAGEIARFKKKYTQFAPWVAPEDKADSTL